MKSTKHEISVTKNGFNNYTFNGLCNMCMKPVKGNYKYCYNCYEKRQSCFIYRL